jgi:hypothetical protein
MLSFRNGHATTDKRVVSGLRVRGQANTLDCRLQPRGWNRQTRLRLEELIRRGARRRLPVVFDFDNTIIAGDISEATLAVLAKTDVVRAARLPATLSPAFRPVGKARVTLESCADITEYYEAFLAPSAHGEADPNPLSNGYVWAVEVMQGLRPLDAVNATRSAFEQASGSTPGFIEVTPGRSAFPVPFFYPEMIELLAELIRHEFDVWIVSAGNVWSLRWMVLHALNPRLRERGLKAGLLPDHVIGISTLLTDSAGRLYKDSLLVRENPSYAALDARALGRFRLTSRLNFPVPTYSGKVACVFDALGRNPYLCVGDSPGDHAMMAVSQHRLWIGRLDKPGYQRRVQEFAQKTGQSGWSFQATLTGSAPGFVPDLSELLRRPNGVPAPVRESARILAQLEGRHRARVRGPQPLNLRKR